LLQILQQLQVMGKYLKLITFRFGLKKVLDFLKEGDVLVVWKLDRLGRSLSHLLQIMTQLRDQKIGFKSLTEQIDTTTPHGELLLHLFGAFAQYERSLARERSNNKLLPTNFTLLQEV